MTDFSSLWTNILAVIKDELTHVSFKTWFETIKPIDINNGVLILSVPNDIHKTTILNNYGALLQNAIDIVSTTELTFDIYVDNGNISSTKIVKSSNNTLNPHYTFDEFVVGKCNEYAHAACLAVAESPAKIYNPLFLYGGAGLGKTHLIHSIGHFILEQNSSAKVLYVTSEKFRNDFLNSISENSIKERKNEEFRSLYRSLDVLLIDDIQYLFLSTAERTQEEFFNTFNALFEANKQIVITSDRPPRDIGTLEERFRSRFGSGMLIDIIPPDFDTRIAILRKKNQSNNMNIPDNIINIVAKSIKSNIRELEGALKRIYLYKTVSNEPITEEFTEEALRDFFSQAEKIILTNDVILKEVSRYFNISPEEIISKKRTKECSYIRHIAMYLCREIVGTTLDDIGEFFGNRDHSTVINACKKIEKNTNADTELKNALIELTKNIKGQ